FYACSADNMNVDELIEFLKEKGKFMPMNDGFTVDVSKVCSH
ncbi:YecH family protein, partial [Parabacteroides goldsteinii]